MPESNGLNNLVKCCVAIASSLAFFSTGCLGQTPDPISSYIVNGKPVPKWEMAVGNALNYRVPVKKQTATTVRKNLTITPTKKAQEGDAIRAKWRGKRVKNEWGGNVLNDSFLSLSRYKIDISSVKDLAALAIELKINRAPSSDVSLSMQCNNSNKCLQKYPLKHVLKKLPRKKWTVLPIPLNCFKSASDKSFDFSRVTTIMSLATQGALDIEIANIGLTALPQGSKGCAE